MQPIPKRQKNGKVFLKTIAPLSKKNRSSDSDRHRKTVVLPKHSNYLKNYIFVRTLKFRKMKQRLDLSNSIYQQRPNGSFSGLTVNDGMLINNRPDGQSGIVQAAQARKAMKQAEKISIIARGNAMGEMLSEMGECSECD
jgi:hypothetical protein